MKRTWEKPSLVILVRRMQVEAVLNGCKVSWGPSGANDYNQGCWYPPATTCGGSEGSAPAANDPTISCSSCVGIVNS